MNAVTFGVYTQIMKRFGLEEADDYETITSLKWCTQNFNILPQQTKDHWPERKEYNGRFMTIATDGPNILTIQQPLHNISHSRMYPEAMLAACPDKIEGPSAWDRIRESLDQRQQREGGFNQFPRRMPDHFWTPSPELSMIPDPDSLLGEEPSPPSLLVESKCTNQITTSDFLLPSNLLSSRRSLDRIYGFYYLMS